ncbi:alpha/beta hydrolase [Aquimarina aquimarini]|uniref:alpha/beta hydrolase n=1 Tax=Aquimarina aquimarini TaxID=1191734 RepID=UPI000D553991|nr:alpha/beta hydrolase family protein [Aquimarina aquimarini]
MMRLQLFLLFLLGNYSFLIASQVDTLSITSVSMNRSVKNVVILPDSYTTQQNKYPVLYLLHGAYGDYRDWVTKAPIIKKYADSHNIIIVCPSGDVTSWYFDSPIDEKMKYETYITKELVREIDKKYRTISHRKSRAITGLSMGGHGALYLAFKHQDIWGAAGSMSGGVDIRPFPNNWDISKRLGSYAENKEVWEQNTVINLTHLLNGDLKLIIDCGYDDFFFDANKRLHQKLVQNNIAHDYIERPGEHNWEYWANAIKYQLLFFNDFFERSKKLDNQE